MWKHKMKMGGFCIIQGFQLALSLIRAGPRWLYVMSQRKKNELYGKLTVVMCKGKYTILCQSFGNWGIPSTVFSEPMADKYHTPEIK